jgi:hypothetical protein
MWSLLRKTSAVLLMGHGAPTNHNCPQCRVVVAPIILLGSYLPPRRHRHRYARLLGTCCCLLHQEVQVYYHAFDTAVRTPAASGSASVLPCAPSVCCHLTRKCEVFPRRGRDGGGGGGGEQASGHQQMMRRRRPRRRAWSAMQKSKGVFGLRS